MRRCFTLQQLVAASIALLALGGAAACGGDSTTAPRPGQPSQVTATPGNQFVDITWTDNGPAASHKIYWDTVEQVNRATAHVVSFTGPIYVHAPLTHGTRYYYVITAVNGSESVQSAEVNASPVGPHPPAAPASFGLAAGIGSNTLNWSPVAGATSYNLYWLFNSYTATGGTGHRIAGVTSPYVHAGLAPGCYSYALTAVNGDGEGPEISVNSVTPTGMRVGFVVICA